MTDRRFRLNTFPTLLSGLVLLLLLAPSVSFSQQLRTIPIPREEAPKAKSSAKFKKQSVTLTLPFWDDFSFTETNYSRTNTTAGYPNDSLWENSSNVWIRTGVAIDAPTINVAHLDGLDSIGNPYATDPQENGIRDVLTSHYIDLSAGQVSPAERGSVYLSFFYQWKGNGEAPDKLDNFRVEFKDKDSVWITAATIVPSSRFQTGIFYDTLIAVTGDDFFHDEFAFRFVSYGRRSGPFDAWNLDYIYLDKGRNNNDSSFPDGALASPAGPLFGDYFSVPYSHFRETMTPVGDVNIDVLNLRTNQTNPDPYTYRTTGTFVNWVEGEPIMTEVLLTSSDRPVRPGNPLLGPMERYTIETLPEDRPDPADTIQFRNMADSVHVKLNFLLLSNDDGIYQSNDTVNSHYYLKDYYAYDDGTAEYAVSVNDNDDQVAVGFKIVKPGTDRLVAFDVYIPRYVVSGFQTGDFFVMTAENEQPKEVVSAVTQVIRRTPRDQFQRVYLSNPVMVEDYFFIGWKGSFTSVLYVGKDSDTDASSKIWINPSGGWAPNITVTGTLMIRPVFGEPGVVVGNEKESTTAFDVYPNPSQGIFYINAHPDQVELIAATGQKVPLTFAKEDDRTRITVPATTSGVFILRMRKGSAIETRKIILQY